MSSLNEEEQALFDAAAQWLAARVTLIARQSDRTTAEHDAQIAAMDKAVAELERAGRALLMKPGMRGSWGRGVPRTWVCGFDSDGLNGAHGCECAGGGWTELACRSCAYRNANDYPIQRPWMERAS